MPSFHILIATTGRPTLQRMLDSLLPQLHSCDHVTIVFDGCTPLPLSTPTCQLHIHQQNPPLGAWGHGIRNEYGPRLERADFVFHADDDDMYVDGIFDRLRELCKRKDCLYITKFRRQNGEVVPPFSGIIRENYIGTPCGIIPYDLNAWGSREKKWLLRRGGDGKFYEAIAKRAKFIKELDIVTYLIG